jgi:hypothetical protein
MPAVGLLCALPLVPDSKNPAARRPDLAGAVLSIAGLGLVLWSIIDAPVHGWSSALVIGTGIAGLAVLAGFVAWERASSHPMLNLQFFRRPSFSAAVGSNGLALFGLGDPCSCSPSSFSSTWVTRPCRPACGCCRSRPR